MQGGEDNRLDEHARAQLDSFLDDHELDKGVKELYQHMVAPSDDTPELIKKLSSSNKKLKKKLKTSSKKLKEGTAAYAKKQVEKRASKDETNQAADEILGRLQAPKTYTPPTRRVTSKNATEGFIAVHSLEAIRQKGAKKGSFITINANTAALQKRLKQVQQMIVAKLAWAFAKKRRKYTLAMLTIIVVFAGALHAMNVTRSRILAKTKPKKSTASATPASEPNTHSMAPAKPDYPTLVPTTNADTIKDKQRYDPAKHVATYEDYIDGARIVVSEQQLNTTQLADPKFMTTLSTNLYLKTQIDTTNGAAYMGTNVEHGTQTVAFAKGNLLVFLQSEKQLDVKTWAAYINGLTLQ